MHRVGRNQCLRLTQIAGIRIFTLQVLQMTATVNSVSVEGVQQQQQSYDRFH